jgi:hypothetical protein
MAERITANSKEMFDRLRLNDFNNLCLMATHMNVNGEQVNVDVICAFDGEPEDILNARDEGGEIQFLPLLIVVDDRNINLLTPPVEALLEDESETGADSEPGGVVSPSESESMPGWPDAPDGPEGGPEPV